MIVCSIENVDPMGVHTGDSRHASRPQQTLTDRLYQKLRDQAIAVIRAVGVETGGSNVQFAVNPATDEIVVIEMNPRVSRSSALASKATGFPIAKIAARLAVGYTLEEIPNDITQRHAGELRADDRLRASSSGRASPSRSSPASTPDLSTHMKSVGEAMAIGRTFEQAFAKAMRSRELDVAAELDAVDDDDAARRCSSARPPTATTSCSRPSARGASVERGPRAHRDRPVVPARAARAGARPRRRRSPASARYKAVDTCAAEFAAETPYYYSGWERRAGRTRSRRGDAPERGDPRLRARTASARASSSTTAACTRR